MKVRVLCLSSAFALALAGAALGATAAGIRTIWVNRGNDALIDVRLAPAHMVETLSETWRIIEDLRAPSD